MCNKSELFLAVPTHVASRDFTAVLVANPKWAFWTDMNYMPFELVLSDIPQLRFEAIVCYYT